ncbi:MAG TPA: hypothetical protein VGL42_00125 [Opitutaceae bacterium]|jgi:hypothetical protein
MSRDPDPFSELIRRFDAPAPLLSDLERKVRARIELKRARKPSLFDRIDATFASPSFATVFVVGCVLLGLFTAEARIAHSQAEQTARLERSYLELIDPLVNSSK